MTKFICRRPNFDTCIGVDALKSLIVFLVLIPSISLHAQPGSQPTEDGSWLFNLKDFSELKFPASMLPPGDPVLLDITLSVDEKGRVHNSVVTPTGTPFSDPAAKAVQKWRFTAGHSGEIKAHFCLGRQDDSQGIGLPCYVYGPEKSRHLRLLLFSSSDLKIESPFNPVLSHLAWSRVNSASNRTNVLWAHAKVVIGEDGSVVEAQTSDDIVDQDLAKSMKQSLRFRPVHLSGHVVEVVAYLFMQA